MPRAMSFQRAVLRRQLKHTFIVVDVPDVVCRNERALMDRAGSRLADRIRQRIQRGLSSSGSELPRASDSQAGPGPLNRTGGLIASIGHEVKSGTSKRRLAAGARNTFYAQVLPLGRAKSGRQSRKLNQLRSLAVVSTIQTFAYRSLRGRRAAGRRVERLKARIERIEQGRGQGERYAAIAAILSLPPKDHNGVKGGRSVYRAIELSKAEHDWIHRYLRDNAQFVLEVP